MNELLHYNQIVACKIEIKHTSAISDSEFRVVTWEISTIEGRSWHKKELVYSLKGSTLDVFGATLMYKNKNKSAMPAKKSGTQPRGVKFHMLTNGSDG